jgi:hypothetical protein
MEGHVEYWRGARPRDVAVAARASKTEESCMIEVVRSRSEWWLESEVEDVIGDVWRKLTTTRVMRMES